MSILPQRPGLRAPRLHRVDRAHRPTSARPAPDLGMVESYEPPPPVAELTAAAIDPEPQSIAPVIPVATPDEATPPPTIYDLGDTFDQLASKAGVAWRAESDWHASEAYEESLTDASATAARLARTTLIRAIIDRAGIEMPWEDRDAMFWCLDSRPIATHREGGRLYLLTPANRDDGGDGLDPPTTLDELAERVVLTILDIEPTPAPVEPLPVLARFRLNGTAYAVETWTDAQWAAFPEAQRPANALRALADNGWYSVGIMQQPAAEPAGAIERTPETPPQPGSPAVADHDLDGPADVIRLLADAAAARYQHAETLHRAMFDKTWNSVPDEADGDRWRAAEKLLLDACREAEQALAYRIDEAREILRPEMVTSTEDDFFPFGMILNGTIYIVKHDPGDLKTGTLSTIAADRIIGLG